jgi:protein-S-isoprenylcysteine O-methyltransferase Ste14
VAIILILLGFLLQWPTLLTLLMFPILILIYGRLAVTEVAEIHVRFVASFEGYAQRTHRFFRTSIRHLQRLERLIASLADIF